LRSDPVKHEVGKETGAMFMDRFLNTAMHYPCSYGKPLALAGIFDEWRGL
jgi:inorganic pyrophosphatase